MNHVRNFRRTKKEQKAREKRKLTSQGTKGCEIRNDEALVDLIWGQESVSVNYHHVLYEPIFFSVLFFFGKKKACSEVGLTELMVQYKIVTNTSNGVLQMDSVFL